MTNTDIMLRYNSVWETFDIDAILEFFAEDGIFDMVNVRKATGHAEIRAVFEAMIRPHNTGRFEILNFAENSAGKVMNERVDRFLRKDGKWISIGVMGVFEFVDGKIAAQRDYFDMQTFRDQMADYDSGRRPSKDE
jgi:limonene-1,2-epoxide hydrolase